MERALPGTRSHREVDLVGRAGTWIRAAADRLISSGVLEREELSRLHGVPARLDSVGRYLQRRGAPGVRLDTERLVVARPVLALLAAGVLGYAAGRALRR